MGVIENASRSSRQSDQNRGDLVAGVSALTANERPSATAVHRRNAKEPKSLVVLKPMMKLR